MGIIGELGSGKTLSLTYLALRNHLKNRAIFANYRLIGIPYTPVHTAEEVLNMRDGFLAADELWQWADSRISGSKRNKFITLVLAKSRKRNINIAYTTQYFKSIDIRIRSVTDFIAIPHLNSKETRCTLRIYTCPAMNIQNVFKFRAPPVFELYDTTEEVGDLEHEDIAQDIKKAKTPG